jgi:pimeloyl-ACP methyl ester carboxylesterase
MSERVQEKSRKAGTERIFETREGLKLVADTWGDPSHSPVLFAHGGGQTRHAWGNTARALGDNGWYTVSIDQRGHGDSAWAPNGDYRFDVFAEDLIDVAAALPKPPVAVGASLGGGSALIAEGEKMADADQGPFAALILVDITPRVEQKGVDRIMNFMTSNLEHGFATLDEAADSIAEYLPHRPRPKDFTGLAKNLRLGDDGRYRWHWDPLMMTGRERIDPKERVSRMNSAASRLRLPTLLVRGGASDLVTVEAAEEFRALVPHAQYADVTGAGHMVAGDRNDAFTSAVTEFLGTL